MSRIAQYEMAFRMQTSVPDLVDISKEPKSVLDLYGPDVTQPGTYAYNCLLARRLAERGVRFTQVFLRGWDHHGDLVRYMELGREMAWKLGDNPFHADDQLIAQAWIWAARNGAGKDALAPTIAYFDNVLANRPTGSLEFIPGAPGAGWSKCTGAPKNCR